METFDPHPAWLPGRAFLDRCSLSRESLHQLADDSTNGLFDWDGNEKSACAGRIVLRAPEFPSGPAAAP
jgi:hypothetical protein